MTSHIFIYGQIGAGDPRTGTKFYSLDNLRKDLDPAATEYVVHISSVGGDVFEGFAMFNILKNTGKKITVQIEGVCASIATLIAAAGDVIRMNRTGKFMIHNPHVVPQGAALESKDLRNVADQLDKIKTLLIDVYQKKTGLDQEKLWAMYDSETWMTADEAKSMGFVDEAEDSLKAVAKIDSIFKNMEQKKTNKIVGMLEEIKAFFSPKAQVTETLEDGRVIMVMTEDGDWAGKQVTFEDGSPLEPGEYILTGGKKFTVGEGSTIEQIQEQQEEPMEDKSEALATAEARIKELEAALSQRNDSEAKLQSEINNFKNQANTKIKKLEEEFAALNLEPAGSTAPAPRAQVQREPNSQQQGDPMADFFNDVKKARGL